MGQVRHIIYACLILIVSIIVITFLTKVSETTLKNEQTAVIDFEPSKIENKSSYGNQLFKTNCATCHAMDKVLSGPALRGVTGRGPWAEDKGNLKKWIKNPAKFISTNQYIKNLQIEYGGQIMTAFSNLSDEEIDAIIEYISNPSPIPVY